MPQRLPKEVKQRRGTYRRSREKPKERSEKPSAPEVKAPIVRDLTAQERAILSRLEAECEAIGVDHKPFGLAKVQLARMLAEAENASTDDPATARVRLYQACHTALAAFGLMPAARDKVAGVPAVKPDGEDDVSLRGPAVQ